MDWIIGIEKHTPLWVWVLMVYLISHGVKARHPSQVGPLKLAIVPTLLTIWGIAELRRIYGLSAETLSIWLAALLAGAAVGAMIVWNRKIGVDRARGLLLLQGDRTVLPLIILTFAAKYALGVIAVMAPDMLMQQPFRTAGIACYGFFAGIFVSKFSIYFRRYLSAPVPTAA